MKIENAEQFRVECERICKKYGLKYSGVGMRTTLYYSLAKGIDGTIYVTVDDGDISFCQPNIEYSGESHCCIWHSVEYIKLKNETEIRYWIGRFKEIWEELKDTIAVKRILSTNTGKEK